MPITHREGESHSINVLERAIVPYDERSREITNALRAMDVSVSFSLAQGELGADLQIVKGDDAPVTVGMLESGVSVPLALFKDRLRDRAGLDGTECLELYQNYVDGNVRRVENMLEDILSTAIAKAILHDYPDSYLRVDSGKGLDVAPLHLEFVVTQGQARLGIFLFTLRHEVAVRLFGEGL